MKMIVSFTGKIKNNLVEKYIRYLQFNYAVNYFSLILLKEYLKLKSYDTKFRILFKFYNLILHSF